ncbi:MAG: hypothetical protein HY908_10600 [Myxococcales bacterium]|nr:hypothetical protein [Myxococcales bacterium]
MPTVAPGPPGSEAVAHWAASRGIGYAVRPDEAWFRAWEPFDTLISASRYYNACSWAASPGAVSLVEPWTEEEEGTEPIGRALLGFAQHPGLRHRAAARCGEGLLTRVSYLAGPPLPRAPLGDARWDAAVVTLAHTPDEARAAFHPRLCEALAPFVLAAPSGGAVGASQADLARPALHLELRPGGLVLYGSHLVPSAEGYAELARLVPVFVVAALAYG